MRTLDIENEREAPLPSNRSLIIKTFLLTLVAAAALAGAAVGGYFYAMESRPIASSPSTSSIPVNSLPDKLPSSSISVDSDIGDAIRLIKQLDSRLDDLESKIDDIESDVSQIKIDLGSIESDISSIQLKIGY
jgi:peptidoglycan hydrolase CwlO-like protein